MPHRLAELSFSVRRGEIVGIAGVEGNGQSELLQAILHPRASPANLSNDDSLVVPLTDTPKSLQDAKNRQQAHASIDLTV